MSGFYLNSHIFDRVVTFTKKGSMGYGKTMLGYKTSLLQWLLTYFDLDEAEKERTYLLFHLKKPDHQPIKPFALHLEQLNAYIQRLPCLKDMPEGVSNSMITWANRLFSVYELEQIILSCIQEAISAMYLQNNHMMPSSLSEFT